MQFPILALFARAVRGFMRVGGMRMDGRQRKIPEHVPHLGGFDKVLHELGQHRLTMSGAKRRLTIGVLHGGHRRVRLAFGRSIADVQRQSNIVYRAGGLALAVSKSLMVFKSSRMACCLTSNC